MSSGVELSHYVPTYIDAKSKFLMFDQDVALASFLIFILGFVFGHPFLGFFVGFAIAYYFNKAKAGLHPDYMLHLTYWVANSPKLKELPESNNRHFFG